MEGIIGDISDPIGSNIQKYIVAQNQDSWTYYARRVYYDERKDEFNPSHRQIAHRYGIPLESIRLKQERLDGIVEEIIFPTGPRQFTGVIGGGYVRLEQNRNGLILVLFDQSLSYGPISDKVFEALREPLLEAYKKNDLVVDVKLSRKRTFSI